MQKVLYILSQTLSIILHPLFMPTYGMILYMMVIQNRLFNLPFLYIWLSIIGTSILTVIIPISLIFILLKKGQIDSLHIENSKQRTTPYIYTLICFGFWCYFLRVTMHLPHIWLFIAIGATIALAIVMLINHWWKISAHLTGMGGLLGGICSMALFYTMLPSALIISVLIISLLLMYARLYTNAHTPMQVVSGYLLGILCTFIPNLIIYYA